MRSSTPSITHASTRGISYLGSNKTRLGKQARPFFISYALLFLVVEFFSFLVTITNVAKQTTKFNHSIKNVFTQWEWVITISFINLPLCSFTMRVLPFITRIWNSQKTTIFINLLFFVLFHAFSRMSLKLPKTEKLTKVILLGNSFFLITC